MYVRVCVFVSMHVYACVHTFALSVSPFPNTALMLVFGCFIRT